MISDDKTRITVTLTKELKDKLDIQAEKESRNTSNLINKIIKEYLEEIKKD